MPDCVALTRQSHASGITIPAAAPDVSSEILGSFCRIKNHIRLRISCGERIPEASVKDSGGENRGNGATRSGDAEGPPFESPLVLSAAGGTERAYEILNKTIFGGLTFFLLRICDLCSCSARRGSISYAMPSRIHGLPSAVMRSA